jgi:nucleoid-associated protein YgaU
LILPTSALRRAKFEARFLPPALQTATGEAQMGTLDPRSGPDKPEKGKADFSDVKSGGSSSASDRQVEQRPATESSKTYKVVAGDSLSKIAKREYGDANEWRRIYEANKHLIDNPDLIYPGQELTIPQR